MLLVVMLEGNRQIAQRRFSIRFGHMRNVITLDRLHEALCHTVALGASHRCSYRLQADLASKQTRLLGDISRAVIAQPLHRCAWQLIAKTLLHAFQHQVSDVITAVACWAGDPADGFSVTAVQSKSYTQLRTIVTAELEAVRAPTSVAGLNGDAAFMPALHARLLDASFQQQIVVA